LVRVLLSTRAVDEVSAAMDVLAGFTSHKKHVFWPDAIPYAAVSLRGVQGHRQITDAYLAALARTQKQRLVTLDGGLAALHEDVADLVPDAGR
jgi:uncharacterized protein